jgi:mRNA interferase MazF
VVLTRTSAVGYLTGITVAPVTTTIRGAPSEVVLDQVDGMRERCVINLDNVNTVPKRQLGEQITRLSPLKLHELSVAIRFALDL